jgi:hypothetical protein
MSDNQYPVFAAGQTLTADDLNGLREFLHQRDRLVGRMVGFGVNCGLGGVVADTTLTVKPGLAVDQLGEPLILLDVQAVTLPPTPVTPSYDFIDAAPGGFSVVLEASDTVEPAPECGEVDCAGHAEQHTTGVEVRVVAGRVTGTRMDFAADPLLTVEPIRLALDSTPVNSYTALRDAIVTRLTNGTQPLVKPALITQLQATSVGATDTAGIRGYKCGWLNMVLFAALDLIRAEALLRLTCDRSTTRPGVVLGWVHQVSSAWVFDDAFRHAWEPPRGLTDAFLGGTSADPAGVFRDDLEALLAGFAPPDPAPVGDPKPPIKCPIGSIRMGDVCVKVSFPPKDIPDRWRDKWQIDPLGPIWNPPRETWKKPDEVYDRIPVDVLGETEFGLTDYLGHSGADVKTVLGGFITDQGAIADVKVMPAADAVALEGYTPAGGFAPSDSVVLGVDSNGIVVSTGRVPTVQNVRTVGSALPAAIGAANEAQQAATDLRNLSTGFQSRFDQLDLTIANLGGNLTSLRTDFTTYKSSFDPSQFGSRISALEQDFTQVGSITSRINVLEGKVDVISKFNPGGGSVVLNPNIGSGGVGGAGGGVLTGGVGGGVLTGGVGPLINKSLGQGIADFAESTVAAMRTVPQPKSRNFQRYAAAAERAHAALAGAVAPDAPEDSQGIAAAALEVLSTLRTLVKASGADAELGKRLDAQIRDLGGQLS